MKTFQTGAAALAVSLLMSTAAVAQNIAVVNGKPVPKARAEALLSQISKSGQAANATPEQKRQLEKQVQDEVVLREIFVQEAERRGLQRTTDYQQQMDLSRQALLIRALFQDEEKKAGPSDAELKAEYDKMRAQADDKEYRARHILVENEDQAKKLIEQIKAGAKFEDLAKKNSKDTGSAENGGDLDWAAPSSYVPEFSAAMTKLQKGQVTDTPVKSQFGYHIIKLEDVRQAQFPPFADVKAQLEQRAKQQRLAKFREDLKNKAKTDYKFSN